MLGIFAVSIAGRSMEPAMRPGDWWLVRQRASVRPGCVVLMEQPDRPDLLVVKRVLRRDGAGWWVQGDNLEASVDSRTYGAVPDSSIRGVLWFRYRRVA